MQLWVLALFSLYEVCALSIKNSKMITKHNVDHSQLIICIPELRVPVWVFIMLLVGWKQNCTVSVSSWRQHHSFPLSVPPREPCDWPERQSVSLWAESWARGVCSALVEEGQLLSAAKEGTERTVQCVSNGQWLVPKPPSNSLPEPLRDKYGVRKTVRNKCETVGSYS